MASPLADGIHDAVGQLQLHLHARIGLQVVRHQPPPPARCPVSMGTASLRVPVTSCWLALSISSAWASSPPPCCSVDNIVHRLPSGELPGGATEQPGPRRCSSSAMRRLTVALVMPSSWAAAAVKEPFVDDTNED